MKRVRVERNVEKTKNPEETPRKCVRVGARPGRAEANGPPARGPRFSGGEKKRIDGRGARWRRAPRAPGKPALL